jgi:ribonucleoside-diphosphate reductase alpha chain
MGGRYVPSLLAAIGEVIERHMVAIGFLPAAENGAPGGRAIEMRRAVGAELVRQCPKCGAAGLTRQEGCDVCISCGYSRCV